jgi:adenosyl cobinamide kinase/adenosyl cobinamide phosphate guanylyltransferase
MLTVLLGGARSGKSTAALRIAERAPGEVCFVATSPRIDGDDDLDRRIEVHRAERPADWRTIEAELDVAGALTDAADAHVIVDCLTLWLGNLVHHGRSDDEILRASTEALAIAAGRPGDTTVVTNEVGLGIVPADATTRRYRDLLGRINQQWVSASDRSYFLVAGRALPLDDLGTIPS